MTIFAPLPYGNNVSYNTRSGAMSGRVFSIKRSINRQKVGNFLILIKVNSVSFTELTFCHCDPVGIRTQDPQLRRLLLYPAELPDRTLSGVSVIILIGDCVRCRRKRMQS